MSLRTKSKQSKCLRQLKTSAAVQKCKHKDMKARRLLLLLLVIAADQTERKSSMRAACWFTLSVACVASVSVGFSSRSRHFSLFGGTKIGASATLMEGAASNNTTETLATQAKLAAAAIRTLCNLQTY